MIGAKAGISISVSSVANQTPACYRIFYISLNKHRAPMDPFWKKTLTIIGWNLLSMLVLAFPILAGITWDHDGLVFPLLAFCILAISLLVQLIVGLTFVSNENKKET